MIIKSMARKEPTFRQLIEYMSDIDKSDEQFNVYQNLFARKAAAVEAEFHENAAHIPKRKNGNYLYHEILSISKAQKLDAEEQKRILRDIAHEYARRRAEGNLVFGALHDDHDEHLHYHLIISANPRGESRKTRLSKAQFDKLKKTLETEVLRQYPELEQRVVINNEAGEKLSRKGAERKRRTGNTPERDAVQDKLRAIFARCASKQDFFTALSAAGFEFYVRGKTLGIKDLATGRKHRLKALGLLDGFQALSDRIELNEEAKTERQATAQATPEPASTEQAAEQAMPAPTETPKDKAQQQQEAEPTPQDDLDTRQTRRKEEIDGIRAERKGATKGKQDKQ